MEEIFSLSWLPHEASKLGHFLITVGISRVLGEMGILVEVMTYCIFGAV